MEERTVLYSTLATLISGPSCFWRKDPENLEVKMRADKYVNDCHVKERKHWQDSPEDRVQSNNP